MRKLIVFAGLLILTSFNLTDTSITEKERKFALDSYEETKQRLVNNVKDLSDAQLNWKVNDSAWSIANCVEHIALSEKSIFDRCMASLKEPANPAKRSELKFTDEDIIKMAGNRAFKVKTREALEPKGQFGAGKDALKIFLDRRESTVNYMKETKEDLRNHFVVHPFFGTLDTYQMLLFQSGHTLRHTLQIQEVKANPDFPKN
jgi:hypothetical protein